MSKNKKARITLEFAIGIVLSILILIAVVNIVGGLFRLNDSSKQSFDKLVSLIKDVSDDPASTVKTTALRMDKETVIIGFTKDDKPFTYLNMKAIAEGGHIANYDFDKPTGFGCEENEACICLYRELYKKDGKLEFKEKSLICKSLNNVEFPNLPKEDPFYYQGNGFVISRSEYFTSEENNPQFRTVFVEKYKGPSGEMVAVCEDENIKKGSCVSENYKKQSEGIEGLNDLAKFIESCKNKEFSGEPCSCGAFDFKYYIPLEDNNIYRVVFDSNENILKLTLQRAFKSVGESLEVETGFGRCKLKSDDDSIKIEYKDSMYLDHIFDEKKPIKPKDYIFYYGTNKDPQIAFIKYDEENICIAYNPDKSTWIINLEDDILLGESKKIKACSSD